MVALGNLEGLARWEAPPGGGGRHGPHAEKYGRHTYDRETHAQRSPPAATAPDHSFPREPATAARGGPT